ncbi:MAG TPA: ABC transporter substrate-binding protein [Candidatus Binatia bacterium]|nr:ABC transporter substrate-binding protein [Candidatus Binatia bacterium]
MKTGNRHAAIGNSKKASVFGLALFSMLFALSFPAGAQQAYRIGVLLPAEPWHETIEGLRVGLKQLGLEEGKQFTLLIRDMKGNMKAAETAARNLERERVDLLYTTSTNVSMAAKRATQDISVVFNAGADPVKLGLVESFAKPGGRFTGVYFRITDLTAKRLEILKEIVPKLRRAVTFYDPRYPAAIESSKLARETAGRLKVELVERHVASIGELQAGLQALRVGEVDAYFSVADPMVTSQSQLIIQTAIVKKLPAMFNFLSFVSKGGLASYSVNFYEVGRLSAKYVQRVLAGVKPRDLPVEGVDKIDFVINLKTAKEIGLTIPPNVLARATKVIQ